MTKNVVVVNKNNEVIGSTYPKRAAGLVKNGRAERLGDCTIRLFESFRLTTNQTEDVIMSINKLFFNPAEWSVNSDCEKSVVERYVFKGIDGECTQIYTLGNWGYNWSEIYKDFELVKGWEYSFVFWLNGGENDRYNEVCQFRVCTDQDANGVIYKLNRNFYTYKKHINGWYLYEVKFIAESERVRLKFVSMSAFMSIMPAKDISEYDGIVDDPIPEGKPQRHNIVFTNGWPEDKWYGGNQNDLSNTNPESRSFANGIFDAIMSDLKDSILW